jgi:DNA polymerase I-like protein with 3'-5' exonuclease and polymerase domains
MINLLFDIETDGLDATVCHSLVIIDVNSGVKISCADNQQGYMPIDEGLHMLSQADILTGHNIMGYDLPQLEKLYGFKFTGEIHDTLLMSRLIWSDLKGDDFKEQKVTGRLIGSHSLKAWGHRLGNYKGDFEYSVEKFAQWSKEMQDYCEQDCHLNLQLYKLMLAKKPSAESIKLEHDFAAIILKQEAQGFNFDEDAAHRLLSTLQGRHAELEVELQKAFPPWQVKEPFTPKVNNKTRGYVKGVKTYKVKDVVFNAASRDHIADRLQKVRGWVPTLYTPSGKPQVDESVLSKLDYPEAVILSEVMLINKRIGMLATGNNAWLKMVKDGKIHGRVNTNGAATGRCTHSKPNVSQTPSINSAYGAECRALFHAPEGYALVGADLSGLELRCLAQFMWRFDDGAYADVILNGDIHTVNQKAAGLATRNQSKTFIYGFLYGGGAEKIGSIVGGDAKVGKKLISKFMKATPALKLLREKVLLRAELNGYLKGLDGRQLPIRSLHSALNMLLQSAGALLAKKATVILYENLTTKGYAFGKDYALVAHVHDEVQLIARQEIADEIGREAVRSFQQAGEHFNFKIPIDGEYKTGRTWADTH